MWTPTTRAQHDRGDLRFASDLTDAEWAVLKPLLPPLSPVGRPPVRSLRTIVEAIVCVLRGGVPDGCCPRASRPGKPRAVGSQPGATRACGIM